MSSTPPDTAIEPVAILADLFDALAGADIRCSHFKSNSHLAEAVRGRTDLDLLVDASRAEDFRRIASGLGFRSFMAAPGKHYAGVENILGHDAASGRLVHLHVHYQLVLGQQFVKDHRIPIERQLLDSTRLLGGVPIPSAAMELSILGVRAVLKYRLRDALKDVSGVRSPAIPRHIRSEAAWLLEQTSVAELRAVMAGLHGALPADLVVEVVQLLTSDRRPGVRPLILRTRMRRAIGGFRRLPRARATSRYLLALARKRAQSAGIARRRRMSPKGGGTTIAFIGSDGAGKSTVISEVEEWLSWRIDVSTAYMGNPKSAAGPRVLKWSTRSARAAHRIASRRCGDGSAVASATRAVWSFLLGARRVAEAEHRYRTYSDAQRRVGAGAVVLFDRYPLDAVRIDGRPMDGPRLEVELAPPRSKLVERMVARERRIYGRILPPDHVIALTVSPDVSQRRKPDHDRAAVDAKTAAIAHAGESDPTLRVVDADRDLRTVVDDVKSVVWDWL